MHSIHQTFKYYFKWAICMNKSLQWCSIFSHLKRRFEYIVHIECSLVYKATRGKKKTTMMTTTTKTTATATRVCTQRLRRRNSSNSYQYATRVLLLQSDNLRTAVRYSAYRAQRYSHIDMYETQS